MSNRAGPEMADSIVRTIITSSKKSDHRMPSLNSSLKASRLMFDEHNLKEARTQKVMKTLPPNRP